MSMTPPLPAKFKPNDKVMYIKTYQEMIIVEAVRDPQFNGLYLCYWIDPVAGEKITMTFEEKHLILIPQEN